MKNRIFTLVLTLMGSTLLFAQQWTGANNTTSDISRTGKVSINTTSTINNLNLKGSMGIHSSGTEAPTIKFNTSLNSEAYTLVGSNRFYSNMGTLGGCRSYFSIGFSSDKTFIIVNDKIGIGTDKLFCTDCIDYRLFVKDGIRTEKIKVDIAANNGWADYVFEPEYNLMPLTEVEQFIKQNGHLPEVPTTAEAIANGIELKEMNILLLKKVEELTLYSIELQKRIEVLESKTTK